jgi:hypothetical protein
VLRTFPNLGAPRVEVDQRSRETRLRLEHVEGLLIPLVPSTRFWLKRGLHCLLSLIGLPAEEAVARAAGKADPGPARGGQ